MLRNFSFLPRRMEVEFGTPSGLPTSTRRSGLPHSHGLPLLRGIAAMRVRNRLGRTRRQGRRPAAGRGDARARAARGEVGGALLGELQVESVVATVAVGGGGLPRRVAGGTVSGGSGVLLVAGARCWRCRYGDGETASRSRLDGFVTNPL